MKKHLAVTALLISNTIPLIGVLFWNWHVFPILVTYWLENVALGFWNILKMRKCSVIGKTSQTTSITINGKSVDNGSRTALMGFFILHYGIFTLVHGIFLFTLFGYSAKEPINFFEIFFAFLVILTSHGISYFYNFLGRNEFQTATVVEQMFKPYIRIIVMHLTIVFGAVYIINTSGQSIAPLLILISLKTVIDLFSHLFEHRVAKGDYTIIDDKKDSLSPSSRS